jgi:integrase
MSDNLTKHCEHAERQWPKCPCAWFIDWQHRGLPVRYSLHEVADKPVSYQMPKTEAEGIRDRIKGQVRELLATRRRAVVLANLPAIKAEAQAIIFGRTLATAEAASDAPLTVGDVFDQYVKKHVRIPGRRENAADEMERQIKMLRACEVPAANGATVRLETKPITAVTKADVDAIRDGRRAVVAASQAALAEVHRITALPPVEGKPVPIPADLERAARLARQVPKGGECGINRLLTRLQHFFSWAIGEGHCESTPFKRHGTLVVKLNRDAEGARSRRLEGDEEARLLKEANPYLHSLILAALETGCRKGELLTLQWGQVDLERGTVFLPAEKTKTHEDRTVPITGRLRAVLEMRRTDPKGEDFPATAYVFGNDFGEEVTSIKTAWKATCRRAGIADLHFHDLRREAGSRLIETPGISLVDVRDWLGHSSVEQTNTYLSTTADKLRAAALRVDEARKRAARAEAAKVRKASAPKRQARKCRNLVATKHERPQDAPRPLRIF